MKDQMKIRMSSMSPMTGELSQFLFTQKVLGKYDANYYLDPKCGYIFIDSPFWLDEAYKSAISALDTGLLARNIRNIDVVGKSIIQDTLNCARGVDLGGGIGVFVRGMRDSGFEFYWTDAYADNALARGFEAEIGEYDVAAAFEVLEHIQNPIAFLIDAKVRYKFSTCFFSATCFSEDAIPARDWWYWVFEIGSAYQFFFNEISPVDGQRVEHGSYHIKDDIYAFSTHPIRSQQPNPLSFLERSVRKLRRIIAMPEPVQRTSLTMPDHVLLRERLRGMQGVVASSKAKFPER